MLRNIGKCYCESTHRLLQKYDKNAQKSASARNIFFESCSTVRVSNQKIDWKGLNDKKTNIKEGAVREY